jgi:hypothetical protein
MMTPSALRIASAFIRCRYEPGTASALRARKGGGPALAEVI